MAQRTDGIVGKKDAAALRARIAADGEHATARWLGVSVAALARAASGCRVQRGTIALVRVKLEQDEATVRKE